MSGPGRHVSGLFAVGAPDLACFELTQSVRDLEGAPGPPRVGRVEDAGEVFPQHRVGDVLPPTMAQRSAEITEVQLVEQDSEGIEVGLLGRRLALEQLGGEVERRETGTLLCLGFAILQRTGRAEGLEATELGPGAPPWRLDADQDLAWVEVVVDHPDGMGRSQGFADLGQEGEANRPRYLREAALAFGPLFQGTLLRVLGFDEMGRSVELPVDHPNQVVPQTQMLPEAAIGLDGAAQHPARSVAEAEVDASSIADLMANDPGLDFGRCESVLEPTLEHPPGTPRNFGSDPGTPAETGRLLLRKNAAGALDLWEITPGFAGCLGSRSGFPLAHRRSRGSEELAVRGAEEEHRVTPTEMACAGHGLACLGDGGVDRAAVRDGAIDRRCEECGQLVMKDLLHPDDGGNPLADEGLCDSGEAVGVRALRSMACVEQDAA